MKDGTYIVKDGVVYEVTPKIKMPISKRVNVMTGEVYYPSNADRIRSMSDEELAELWWECVDCGECPVHRDCRMTGQDCKKLALDWLREEVNNNSTT